MRGGEGERGAVSGGGGQTYSTVGLHRVKLVDSWLKAVFYHLDWSFKVQR
jgi:hypothetical protein